MDFSKLSYSEIQAKSQELSTSATTMQEILTEVENLFAKIGSDDTWSGTAASTTKETFDTLKAKFPEFYQSVSDCSKYLNEVVANYQSVDSMIMGQQ